MKATLLIKNIASLYTCDEEFTVLHDAFLALKHDKILDLGTHDWKKYLDDSTTVIDGHGHCVIPALIDPYLCLPAEIPASDKCYLENAAIHYMQKNGILSLVSFQPQMQYSSLQQQVYYRPRTAKNPIVSNLKEFILYGDDEFILSCKYHPSKNPVYSMLPLASCLYKNFDVAPESLLAAMTCRTARVCRLKELGSIQKGKQADLLVIHSNALDTFFQTEGISLISHMIKRGIPIYPKLRRV
jgi:imidazolonepropionase-like amidohydrolase